jgi:hypothetical protein
MSGIDWKPFLRLRIVMDRYVTRLQVLNCLLNSTALDSEVDTILILKKAQHNHIFRMLSPYRLYSASPPEIQVTPKHSWAIPIFKERATTHARYIDSIPSLSQSPNISFLTGVQRNISSNCWDVGGRYRT